MDGEVTPDDGGPEAQAEEPHRESDGPPLRLQAHAAATLRESAQGGPRALGEEAEHVMSSDKSLLERLVFRYAAQFPHPVLGVYITDTELFIVDRLEADGVTPAHCVRYRLPAHEELHGSGPVIFRIPTTPPSDQAAR
jgi:hypothetical protein